jgi:hypothetical protein
MKMSNTMTENQEVKSVVVVEDVEPSCRLDTTTHF